MAKMGRGGDWSVRARPDSKATATRSICICIFVARSWAWGILTEPRWNSAGFPPVAPSLSLGYQNSTPTAMQGNNSLFQTDSPWRNSITRNCLLPALWQTKAQLNSIKSAAKLKSFTLLPAMINVLKRKVINRAHCLTTGCRHLGGRGKVEEVAREYLRLHICVLNKSFETLQLDLFSKEIFAWLNWDLYWRMFASKSQ